VAAIRPSSGPMERPLTLSPVARPTGPRVSPVTILVVAAVHAGLFYTMSYSARQDRASAPVSMLVDLVPMIRAPDERRLPVPEADRRPAPPAPAPLSPRFAGVPAPASSVEGMLPPSPQDAAFASSVTPAPAMAGGREGSGRALGTPDGGAAGSERVGGAAGAATDPYPAMVLSWLEAHKRYPDRARLAGQEGVVTVAITLDRRGRLIRVNLVTSSGHALLDDAALAQVRDAHPFPPAPPGAQWSRRRFEAPIVYRLRPPPASARAS